MICAGTEFSKTIQVLIYGTQHGYKLILKIVVLFSR